MTDSSTARWFKSSRSSGQHDCVEVAFLSGERVGVRDSKNPTGPILSFEPAEWDRFLGGLTVDGQAPAPGPQ